MQRQKEAETQNGEGMAVSRPEKGNQIPRQKEIHDFIQPFMPIQKTLKAKSLPEQQKPALPEKPRVV
jgi:hypothetical protein